MNYTVGQLRAFLALADEGGFTRAAARLHLSQPALTVQIRNLEQALGAKLFDRDARGATLTAIGASMAPALRRLLSEIDSTLDEALESAAGRRGTIRIAALPSFAASSLPETIARFRDAHPGIGFVIRDAIAERVVAAVQSGAVDLGVTAGVELTDDLEVLHEATDQLCVVAPAKHPFASRKALTLDDLAKLPLIMMEPQTSVRALVDAAFISAGRAVHPVAEATYMMTAVGLVAAGLGVAILPESAREIAAAPDLRRLKIADARFERRILLVKKRGRSLSPATASFAKELTATMSQLETPA